MGRARARSRRRGQADRARRRARGARVRGAVRPPARPGGVVHRVIPWEDVSLDEGTGIVHIAPGAGPRTSSSRASTTCPCWPRSTRPGACCPASASTASPPTRSRSPSSTTFGTAASFSRRGRSSTATRRAGGAARRSSSGSSTTGSSPPRRSGSRCSTRTRGRVDAGVLLEAHGRLAPEHGRLEHLAEEVLRAPVALLSLRGVRHADGDRIARRARGTCPLGPRAAAGAASTVDRRGDDRLLWLRGGGAPHPRGRRCLARRGHRPPLDARMGEPGVRSGGLCDWCRARD